MRTLLLILSAGLAAAAPQSLPLFFTPSPLGAPSGSRFTGQGAGVTAQFFDDAVLFRCAGRELRLRFAGARSAPRVEGAGPMPGRANFFTGPDAEWRTDVPLFGSVVYRDLYPGIDMAYGGHGRRIKSEFVVAPGADPARIHLMYEGVTPRIGGSGELVLWDGAEQLVEAPPEAYQMVDGNRVAVEAAYLIDQSGGVGFGLAAYDDSLPLVIDPVLTYSTYLGGHGMETATAVAVDAAGNTYVAGYTDSYDFPEVNPAQGFLMGSSDAFVVKLDATGGLVYSTYLGGSGDDRAYGIAVDAAGAAYVTGYTASKNFPLVAAQQAKQNGSRNAFVLKLNAAGNKLVYSTYFGGVALDGGTAIAVDGSGRAYVAGDSTSSNFPTTSLQRANRGAQDAFVARLGAGGSLQYCTLLGGNDNDHAAGIAVDSAGAAYVAGYTWSTNFPLAAAYQSRSGGGQDAFIAKITAAGDALVYSTYWGGSGGSTGLPEAANAIAVDAAGQAYVTGVTGSTNFPVVAPLQAGLAGATDAFVLKLSATGVPMYSTYLGGSGIDNGNAIAVDANGVAYVAGDTLSTDLAMAGPLQPSPGGDYDILLAAINPTGSVTSILTVLGGSGSDTAFGIALDTSGGIHLVGRTLSQNFPLQSAYQTTNFAQYGAFAAVISSNFAPVAQSVTPSTGGGSSQVFSVTASDANGNADIKGLQVLINGTLNGVGACWVYYSRGANLLYLAPDAGASTWLGPIAAGSSGVLQNSQCSLDVGSSGASATGNALTLRLALTFKTAFGGLRAIYVQAFDGGRLDSAWQHLADWTVPGTTNLTPVPVSVTPPAPGSLNYTFVGSDGNGYLDIDTVQVVINFTLSGVNGCWLYYSRTSNQVYLATDTAGAWLGPLTLGAVGVVQNSQCSLDAAASSAAGNGNNLTLVFSLTFKSGFAGGRNFYMTVSDRTGANSGVILMGNYPAGVANVAPVVISVTPASGSGISQTFAFKASDGNGFADIETVQVLINGTLTGSSGCWLYYSRSANQIYLFNDNAGAWSGPLTLGATGTLQNAQCALELAASSAAGSGNLLTLSVALSFKGSFGGGNLYLTVQDRSAAATGWQTVGKWTALAAAAVVINMAPVVASVTPSSGSASSRTFTYTLTDGNGYADIDVVQAIINGAPSVVNGCWIYFTPSSNLIYLAADNAGTWLGPAALGAATTLQNSLCSVDVGNSSASGTGNSLALNLALTFKSAFRGTKNLYGTVSDRGGLNSGWVTAGSWTVP